MQDYVAQLAAGFERITRHYWAGVYLHGLLLDGERKRLQPLAGSLHYAAPKGDYPLALRLFLPETWTSQPQRMQAVRVPAETQVPCTKGEIALDLLDQVRAEGLAHQAVVADAGYGLSVDFRRGLEERHERYVVGIAGQDAVLSEPPTWNVRAYRT